MPGLLGQPILDGEGQLGAFCKVLLTPWLNSVLHIGTLPLVLVHVSRKRPMRLDPSLLKNSFNMITTMQPILATVLAIGLFSTCLDSPWIAYVLRVLRMSRGPAIALFQTPTLSIHTAEPVMKVSQTTVG